MRGRVGYMRGRIGSFELIQGTHSDSFRSMRVREELNGDLRILYMPNLSICRFWRRELIEYLQFYQLLRKNRIFHVLRSWGGFALRILCADPVPFLFPADLPFFPIGCRLLRAAPLFDLLLCGLLCQFRPFFLGHANAIDADQSRSPFLFVLCCLCVFQNLVCHQKTAPPSLQAFYR